MALPRVQLPPCLFSPHDSFVFPCSFPFSMEDTPPLAFTTFPLTGNCCSGGGGRLFTGFSLGKPCAFTGRTVSVQQVPPASGDTRARHAPCLEAWSWHWCRSGFGTLWQGRGNGTDWGRLW